MGRVRKGIFALAAECLRQKRRQVDLSSQPKQVTQPTVALIEISNGIADDDPAGNGARRLAAIGDAAQGERPGVKTDMAYASHGCRPSIWSWLPTSEVATGGPAGAPVDAIVQ